MADVLRVVHYLNAFFGGVGGEAEAQTQANEEPPKHGFFRTAKGHL